MSDVMRLLGVVLIAGNILALAAGLALLITPQKIVTLLGLRSVHPVSVRRVTKKLEVPRNSEQYMLRYPRVLGLALLAGGIYVIVKGSLFVSALNAAEGGRMLSLLFPRTALTPGMWESLWIVSLGVIALGAMLAILVGLLALMQVETLKKISGVTNRWVSTRQAFKPASRPYYGIDRFVATHPQAWGAVLTLLAIYTLVMIIWFGRGLM